jgi:hypothetical protein
MSPVFIVLLALGAVSLLVWALTHRRKSPVDGALEELPVVGDIKPRVQINRNPSEDPCRPLDAPDVPSVIVVTQVPKMTKAEALQAANRNRQAEGRLRAQKAKEALDAKGDPTKIAVDCGYKTVKYMREKVRELEREALSE